MNIVYLILLVLAVLFFAASGFNAVASRFNLIALGLLCVALVELIRLLKVM